MFSVLAGPQLPSLAAKSQEEIWFSWTPLCFVAFIYLNAWWKSGRKKSPLHPSETPQFRDLPSVEKSWFWCPQGQQRWQRQSSLGEGVSAASSHVGAVLAAAAAIPLHPHTPYRKPRLPLHLAQCAGIDGETGKDAGLGVWAQFVVLSFNGERGKGLHLITVKHKMLPWYTRGLPYSPHRDREGSKSWQMEAWCNALAPSKTLSWKWYLCQGRRN